MYRLAQDIPPLRSRTDHARDATTAVPVSPAAALLQTTTRQQIMTAKQTQCVPNLREAALLQTTAADSQLCEFSTGVEQLVVS